MFIYTATCGFFTLFGAVNLPWKEIWSRFACIFLAVKAPDRRGIYGSVWSCLHSHRLSSKK